MLRLIFFFLVVAALGFLFSWVADRPGVVSVDWLGTHYEASLMVALSALVTLIALCLFVWGMLRGIIRTPFVISHYFSNRRRDRGYKALSQGLIAASSGDAEMAKSLARESGKLLENEPLVGLLKAQTALLEGRRDDARTGFQQMLGDDNTKLVALRGLYLEAERQGETEAARHYATEAAAIAPALPWAGGAKLRYQAVDGDWDEALKTLETNRAAGLIDKDTAKRHRAVLLTAKATEEEPRQPEAAVKDSHDAHKLARDLVPAAVVYAQASGRQNDIRGATKVLETTWKLNPHPELAEVYLNVRSGDSAQDRLKRAKRLQKLQPDHPEGALAVCGAAIDAKDWELARKTIESVLTSNLTERACLLMADIEEGEHGDKGRMRDWLSRAVNAAPDPVWTADGQVSAEWLPFSPITGEIDAFEWKVPVNRLGASENVLSEEDLAELNSPPVIVDATTKDGAEVEVSDDETIIDVVEVKELDTETVDTSEAPEKDTSAGDTPPGSENAASNNDEFESENPSEETDESESKGTVSGNVKFPLERRPDDPGVKPKEEEDKKGLGIF